MEDWIMLVITVALITAALAAPAPLHFDREKIGAATYEAASVFDVNNDGAMDIVSGEFWFQGPDFKTSHKICTLAQMDDYYDDFSCYPMDVNGDGYLDIISGGWWGGALLWRENPKGQPVEWQTHEVAKTGNIERNCFYDLDGDGVVEVFPVSSPVHIFKLKRDAQGKGLGGFEQHTITTPGGGGHGIGFGDVNSDGRPDLIFPGGWFEAPANPYAMDQWVWHKEFDLGSTSVPILVFDVNGDKVNDLIVGSAHDYGLWWYEQGQDASGQRTWTKHDIDPDRSQYHDLVLVDIDNDGAVELVAGKRYRAHAVHDPGSLDPVGVYYFEINGGDFQRVTLDYGPAQTASGVGIYLWVEDIDKNGWKDVVAPGKEGLYLFRNYGPLARP
jgi:hypothetical protein